MVAPGFVYVPRQPGPLIEPAAVAESDDEVDELLDDLFGEDVDAGPGRTDAALVVGGAAAVGVGQLLGLAGIVTVLGLGALLLGLILPVRSLSRRWSRRRRERSVADEIGDALPLRQDHVALVRLAGLHTRILRRAEALDADVARRSVAVAHAQLEEVATLLDGRVPAEAVELRYVEARVTSLAELASLLEDPGLVGGGTDRRRAETQARIEVEEASGRSALTDAAELRDELSTGLDS